MPVTKTKIKWVSGNFTFTKADGTVIMTIDATNRDVNIPTGATLTVADGISGTMTYGIITDMAATGTSTANTVGVFAGASRADHVHKLGDHDHSATAKGGALADVSAGCITLTESAIPVASLCYITRDDSGAVYVNAITGKTIILGVNGTAVATIAGALVTIAQAVTVSAGALTVSVGGASITGGLTVPTGGLTVSAGTTSAITSTNIGLTGIVAITGATTVTGNLTVTGSLTWGGPTAISEALTVDELILDTDGAALANTVCGLWRDNAGDASLQAVSGKEVKFLIASVVEAEIGGSATIFNEASGDRDFRVESANLQYALYVDGGKDCVVVGDDTDISDVDYRLMVGNVAKTLATGQSAAILYVAPTASTTEFSSGTHGYIASAYFKEPNITGAGGDTTVAATVYIADAPTEATANHALYVASGSTSLQGALTVTGATLLDGGAFTFNESSADLDFRVESNGLQYALAVDGDKDCVVIGDNTDISDVDYRLRVGNVAKTLVDNQSAAIMSVAPTAATTESGTGATTHGYIATAYFAEPSITHAGTSAITVASTVYINDAPTEGSANAALYIASGALIMASGSVTLTSGGITLTNGNLTFAAASDIIMAAATAAALEVSDGTTKYYVVNTQVTQPSITTHTWNISAYTIASADTNVETGWSFAAHTLNYTGAVTVNTQVDTIVLGARTITGDTATLTVAEANTLLAVAPTEGGNVAITAASAIRVINAGGTPTSQYGLYIEDLTVGATNDVGIYIAGADTAAIYVAADSVRLADSVTLGLGTGTGLGAPDATITYNGTNVVINPKVIGTGVIALGSGEAGIVAGSGSTLRAIDVATGGLGDVNGANLTIAAGLGTGTGTRGTVIIQTPQIAGAGDNPQTLETMMTFGEDITTLKAGSVFQSDGAAEIGISVDNAALVVGTAGSLVVPYLSSTGNAFSDAIGGDNDGCIGINYDSDTGPTATLEARVNGGWLSVAVTGTEIQGRTFGGGKKHGEKWHDNQIIAEGFVDETICAKCGTKMKVGDKIALYANYERISTDGSRNLHAIYCHADC